MRTLTMPLAAALMAGMLVACSASQPHDTSVTLAHGLTVTVRGGAPKISGQASPTSITASLVRRLPVKLLAPAEQVTITGKLPAGGAILTWRLNPKMLSPGMTPFMASLDQATGQWTALPGSYDRKVGAISTRIPADPVVAPFGWIGSQIASMLQGALLSVFGLSGTGVYPQCSSYDVPITDSHPAEASIGFCAQPAGSAHVLVKLASMRPYPMDVTYPAGTSVSPSVLSRIIAPGSGRAILAGLDYIDAVLPLNQGNSTQVTVRLDGPALAAGLLGVAETLASKLGGKPKAILDVFENTKCFAHAVLGLDSVTEPTLRDAQDAGSTILECAGQALENSKNVAAIIGTAVIFAASLAGDAIFAAWGTIDKLMRNSDHVLTIQWPALATHKVYLSQQGNLASAPRQFEPPCNATEDCLMPTAGCDSGVICSGTMMSYALLHMTWSTWSDTQAVGAGTAVVSALGRSYSLPVQVTLSQPVKDCSYYYWTNVSFTYPSGVPATVINHIGGGEYGPYVFNSIVDDAAQNPANCWAGK
jgi:hypothetical protein